ncbi:hypothetical protein AgCh_009227 [Apium graveolens]
MRGLEKGYKPGANCSGGHNFWGYLEGTYLQTLGKKERQVSLNSVIAMAKQYLVQWKEAQSWLSEARFTQEIELVLIGSNHRDAEGELVQATTLYYDGMVPPALAETMAKPLVGSKQRRGDWVQLESDLPLKHSGLRF